MRIGLADGSSVMSDDADADTVLSSFFGRDVELAQAAENGYTIDQYHPDEENYDPEGHRDEVVEAELGAALFNSRGLPSAVAEGAFFDLFPFSVLTTSTLDQLGELEPQSRFDVRRFRMNVIVDTPASGFVENEWVGRTLAIGDEVQLGVALPDPRCVMPSLPQEDLPRDPRSSKPSPSTTGSTWRARSTPVPASTPSPRRRARSARRTRSTWSDLGGPFRAAEGIDAQVTDLWAVDIADAAHAESPRHRQRTAVRALDQAEDLVDRDMREGGRDGRRGALARQPATRERPVQGPPDSTFPASSGTPSG